MLFGCYLLRAGPYEGFLGIKSACLYTLDPEGYVMVDYTVIRGLFDSFRDKSDLFGVSGPIFVRF